jgi:hypothetical protein
MEGRIDLVLFDLDDVLYHYSRRRRAERLSTSSRSNRTRSMRPSMPRVSLQPAIGADGRAVAHPDSGLEAAGDRGALGREAYLQAFGERIGRPVSLAEWVRRRL